MQAGRVRRNESSARKARSSREDLNAPLWKVWAMLKPTLRSACSDEYEATLMLAIYMASVLELKVRSGRRGGAAGRGGGEMPRQISHALDGARPLPARRDS